MLQNLFQGVRIYEAFELGCLECSFKEHPDPRSVRFFSLLLTMGLPLSHAATNEAEEPVN